MSFVSGSGRARSPAMLWAGWFTLCAVIAMIGSDSLVDHGGACFAIFTGLTLSSIWLRICVCQLQFRFRAWWTNARARDDQGNTAGD